MLSRFIERLERSCSPKVESVSVSSDALTTLASWGFTRLEIESLKSFVKELDGAYLNCLKKVEAMKVLQKRGKFKIAVPHFNDNNELFVGGSCREITDSVIQRILESGIIERVNIKSKEGVELRIVKGTNTSHFRDSGHIWCGLVSKLNSKDMVVIDASYQEISHLKSNGYKVWFSDFPSDVEKVTETELSVSSIDVNDNSIEALTIKDKVLGLSTDKSVSFAIGFTTTSLVTSSQSFDTIVPFIRVGGTNGVDDAIFLLNPKSNEINSDFKNKPFMLTDAATQELNDILIAAAKIRYEDTVE